MEKVKERIKELSGRKARAEREIRALQREIEDMRRKRVRVDSLREKLKEIEETGVKIEKMEKEILALADEISRFPTKDYEDLESKVESMRKEIEELKKIWTEYTEIRAQIEREGSIKDELKRREGEIEKLKGEISHLREEMERIKYSREEYERVQRLLVEVERKLQSLKTERGEKVKRVEEIEAEMEKKEKELVEAEKELEFYSKMRDFNQWMRSEFIPALDDIEKLRMLTINEEFRRLFENWFFELLGESDYDATIDEEFKPIVRYQKFDMPLGTLSGGERTSVALAYRLALNTMVKRILGLDTNLLILDEPTDGFSKDQLYKLKDIFEKMDTDQIIIVTHEEELRSLADRVFRVEKIDGVSRIRIV